MKKQRLNCHFLKRWKDLWNSTVTRSMAGFFVLFLLSLLLMQAAPKTNLSPRKKNSHISHPISSSGPPWIAATASFSIDLAGDCGLLLFVPLTSILSVKNSIPHCWKQQFANQASLESCLMEHYREQKGKFKQICFSNFLRITDRTCPLAKCFWFAL